MSAQLSELQFYNQMTGGNATSARQGKIQYINNVMGTNYHALEVAEKAYYEYLKDNPPTPAPDPDQALIENGQNLATTVNEQSVVLTPQISNNAITGFTTNATAAVVTDGETFPVTGGSVTVTVANNEVTMEFTPE